MLYLFPLQLTLHQTHNLMFYRLTAPIPSAITETALNAQMKALTTLDTCN